MRFSCSPNEPKFSAATDAIGERVRTHGSSRFSRLGSYLKPGPLVLTGGGLLDYNCIRLRCFHRKIGCRIFPLCDWLRQSLASRSMRFPENTTQFPELDRPVGHYLYPSHAEGNARHPPDGSDHDGSTDDPQRAENE